MANMKAKTVRIPSAKSDEQPATRKMLGLVRKELIHRMDSGFNRMEARFSEFESKFSGLESKFHSFESRFSSFESRFSGLEASNARILTHIEEQSSNNRIVLEGLQSLWQRQERLEEKLDASLPTRR